jgi:hypothetical protein
MKEMLRVAAKKALAPLIYRFPPFGLQPERLATYLHSLLERQDLPGDVAEIGCNLGGTSAIAARMLKRLGWKYQFHLWHAVLVEDLANESD